MLFCFPRKCSSMRARGSAYQTPLYAQLSGLTFPRAGNPARSRQGSSLPSHPIRHAVHTSLCNAHIKAYIRVRNPQQSLRCGCTKRRKAPQDTTCASHGTHIHSGAGLLIARYSAIASAAARVSPATGFSSITCFPAASACLTVCLRASRYQ